MTRRDALGLAAPAMLAAGPQSALAKADELPLIKPPVLKPGDTVGVISPSTQVTDPDQLQLAQMTVEYFGLRSTWAAHSRSHRARDVATVEERVDDLHKMFADQSVRAIFCIRGGYGSAQLLPSLDYSLIRNNPKIFIGYSDITALHLAIQKKAGLVTFHGPVLLSEFTPFTQDIFKRALFSNAPLGPLSNPKESNPLRPAHRRRVIHEGKAEGRLTGGNLSLIASLMGTPFEIETTDRIFFTEDVGEEPYRIDRMLTQLRLAGKLDAAVGILMGECKDCGPNDFKPSSAWNMTFGEVLDDRFRGLQKPVLSGLTIGHTSDQFTLPLGIKTTLDAGAGQLILEESATE